MIAHIAQSPVPASLEVQVVNPPNHSKDDVHALETNLLQGPTLAKPNPNLDPATRPMMDRVMALTPRYGAIKPALKEYLVTDRTLNDIAQEYSCTAAALLYWIRKLGLHHRKRGRRLLQNPTEDHNRVIALVRNYGVAETARREGVSRQRVFHIVCRWAPELKGRRIHQKAGQSSDRQSRKYKVSLELSADEWRLLRASQPVVVRPNMSPLEKARVIILRHLKQAGVSANSAVEDSSPPLLKARHAQAVNAVTAV